MILSLQGRTKKSSVLEEHSACVSFDGEIVSIFPQNFQFLDVSSAFEYGFSRDHLFNFNLLVPFAV